MNSPRSLLLHDDKLKPSRMSKNDDNEAKFRRPGGSDSPQLIAVKDLLNAYCTLDTEKVDALLPEDYVFFALPKDNDIPPEDKRDHLKRWSKLFDKLKSIEVRIQCPLRARRLTVRHR